MDSSKSTAASSPPRNGEGDRGAKRRGGGGPAVLRAPIKAVKRARGLRKEMSPPEAILWQELRRRPGGFKFRRQCPQPPYTLDFACLEVRLAIEVDGGSHDCLESAGRDERRDRHLERLGFATMRVPAVEVYRNLDGVLSSVVDECRTRGPLHRPASPAGPPPRSGEEFA